MRDRPASFTLGIVLLVIGMLALLVRLGGWDAFRWLLKLWPLVLVWLGVRMMLGAPKKERSVDPSD